MFYWGPPGFSKKTSFFLVYTNSLPRNASSDSLLFVNDEELWKKVCNQEDKLAHQEDLTRLQQWMDNNKLIFNIQKCEVAHLRHVVDHDFNLGNFHLEVSQGENDLGVLAPYEILR